MNHSRKRCCCELLCEFLLRKVLLREILLRSIVLHVKFGQLTS
jgi:hypothetical protein